jgi:hypothetical protein
MSTDAAVPMTALSRCCSEIFRRSLGDREHKGCILVNAALDVAPDDLEFQQIVARVLVQIETFFRTCAAAGQVNGTITRSHTHLAQTPNDSFMKSAEWTAPGRLKIASSV